jgi:hypothetical protein
LQQIRNRFAVLCPPWFQGGIGIVRAANIVATKLELEGLIAEFATLADQFVADYATIQANDRIVLGSAFSLADYPSQSELRAKFYAGIEIIPLATNFAIEGIEADIKERIEAENAKILAARLAETKRDLVSRIETELRHLSDRLATKNDKAKFHGSAISNVAETCDQVLRVQFDDDPALIGIAEKIKEAMRPLSADTIRENEAEKEKAKETVAASLADISQVMAGFMS